VPEHLQALARLGPSVHHRRFFAPVVAARERHQGMTIAAEVVTMASGAALEASAGI